jgi:hypothetical protein
MLARSREHDRRRFEVAARDGAEAPARNGEAGICGTCWQCLSSDQQVNICDLKEKLQRRIDMIVETAKELSKLQTSPDDPECG